VKSKSKDRSSNWSR